jgi:hypothetical protein
MYSSSATRAEQVWSSFFFCMSGVLGSMHRHPSLTTRENVPEGTRPSEADVLLLAGTLSEYLRTVIVVGNDRPFNYDLGSLWEADRGFGRRVANAFNTLGSSTVQVVLDFMTTRIEPFVVLASPDFEFTHRTSSSRIDLDQERGFDEAARAALEMH